VYQEVFAQEIPISERGLGYSSGRQAKFGLLAIRIRARLSSRAVSGALEKTRFTLAVFAIAAKANT
jgi:hypothetical protein